MLFVPQKLLLWCVIVVVVTIINNFKSEFQSSRVKNAINVLYWMAFLSFSPQRYVEDGKKQALTGCPQKTDRKWNTGYWRSVGILWTTLLVDGEAEERAEAHWTRMRSRRKGWSISCSSHTVQHCHWFFDCVTCALLLKIFKRSGPEAMIIRLRFQCFCAIFSISCFRGKSATEIVMNWFFFGLSVIVSRFFDSAK